MPLSDFGFVSPLRVRWCGEFGNQLFSYCLGRILHLETGFAVSFPPRFTSRHGEIQWLWKPQSQKGKRIWSWRARVPVSGQRFDRDLLGGRRALLLCGNFQQYSYFQPYKALIRQEWLELPSTERLEVDSRDLYVHVRRTDYVDTWSTPSSLLAKAIESFPSWRRLVIVTEDVNDPFHQIFEARYGAVVQTGTVEEDFLRLAAARQVVMSQSTFSWWATFLGRAERVVCPVRRNLVWDSPTEGIHLFVRDDSRFEYLWSD